jgi:hypothetical protein
MKKKSTTPKLPALPAPVTQEDLTRPADWKELVEDFEKSQFEMWYVPSFGWVIPTLLIRRSQRADRSNRTYAKAVSDGRICRVGLGPHVTAQVTVYVRKVRAVALQALLDLKFQGEIDSNTIRDRISSRRAQTMLRRSSSRSPWSGFGF